jgi:nucleoside-diphosphate-sugar epimerase
VAESVGDPVSYNSVNIEGTLGALIASKDEKVKKVVYISSSAVYGDDPELPKVEDMQPKPYSPYAISKLAGEYYCKMFHYAYRVDTVVLRLFNVFGPRQNPESEYAAVIPKFIVSMLKGRPLTIYGDGEQSRDFTHVENVVDGIISACRNTRVAGEVINLASGHRTTVNGLVEVLSELIENHTKPIHAAQRPGDVKHSLADISKARKLLRYEPNVLLRDGLERPIGWFLQKA